MPDAGVHRAPSNRATPAAVNATGRPSPSSQIRRTSFDGSPWAVVYSVRISARN